MMWNSPAARGPNPKPRFLSTLDPRRSWPLFLLALLCAPAFAQTPDTAFFEAKIRPVLVAKCYACHSSGLKAPMGGLVLDSKAGWLKGGATGSVIVPGKPAESRLLKALRFDDPNLQMPPTGKLPDAVIADFQQWIAAGAPDPRTAPASAAATPAPLKGMPIDEGRKWWAFQPVRESAPPPVKDTKWARTAIDNFVLAKLEKANLKPSPAASSRELVQRVYIDLVGYKPTFEETEAFVNDRSPQAYENLVDRLLASKHYGERWGRHWMDVARFAEDNPTSEATVPPYPFAWRYRDWIIEAVNKDVPYDKFVKLQLAADMMPDTPREDLRALGYLGAAPVYHKDQRLSEDVTFGFMTDDWDERVDAVSRGLLGMTVACARCHDHKFDPILTKDYYALAGVFASTMRAERPLFETDPKVEERFLWVQRRLFDLRYSADLLTNEASTVVDAAPRVAKWKAEIASLQAEMEGLRDKYPQMVQHLERYWTFQQRGQRGGGGANAAPAAGAPAAAGTTTGAGRGGVGPAAGTIAPAASAAAGRGGVTPVGAGRGGVAQAATASASAATATTTGTTIPAIAGVTVATTNGATIIPSTVPAAAPATVAAAPAAANAGGGRRGNNATSREPFINAVYDAAQFADGSDPHYTMLIYKPGEARNLPVMLHGNVTSLGDIEPRHFLTVLSKGDSTFKNGSGRLELADRIFTDAAPLSARVIVNRVWDWHFGKPLALTTSDFGTQGEKPSHPELLDDLAARFIAHGWSLKWLNREIVLSAAYRQSSHPRADGDDADPTNTLLWRMNPRRMEIEAYRDSLLRAAGTLSEDMYGPSEDVESLTNVKRTVYGRVSRSRVSNLLRLYDFPDPIQTTGGRDLTTTSLQQLFLMNSPFIHNLADALAKTAETGAAEASELQSKLQAEVRTLYRNVLSRDPSSKEVDLAISFLGPGAASDKPSGANSQSLLAQYAQVLLSTNEEILWP